MEESGLTPALAPASASGQHANDATQRLEAEALEYLLQIIVRLGGLE
jgi:hypothetical protein